MSSLKGLINLRLPNLEKEQKKRLLVNWALVNNELSQNISGIAASKVFLKKNCVITNYMHILSRNTNLSVGVSVYDRLPRLLIVLAMGRKQMRVSLTAKNRLIKCFTAGYVLRLSKDFSKGLKKRQESSILVIKFLISTIDTLFSKNKKVLVFKGGNVAFSRILLFIKKKLFKKKICTFYFSTNFNTGYENIKKIKAIKRRMKKKYIYNNLG